MKDTMTIRYNSMDDIRRANDRAGHHFFEPSTMRFFHSKIASGPFAGRYFVTSEQFDHNSPRLYTVRVVDKSGHINTVDGFQRFSSVEAAKRAIRALIRDEAVA